MNKEIESVLRAVFGDSFEDYEKLVDKAPLRGFRVNTLKTTESDFFRYFPLSCERSPFADNGYVLREDIAAGAMPSWHAGLFYMQEPSAASAVSAMGIVLGMKVLDRCAAPGSKTTQLAEKLENEGFLLANEFVASRSRILLENIERHGSACTCVTNSSVDKIAERFHGFFDAVLCDAPCSGEGMFRKNPDAMAQWSMDNVAACARRQKEILEYAYDCVAADGILLYSTCTFNKEENEKQVLAFLRAHPDMTAEKPNVDYGLPSFELGEGTGLGIRIDPMHGGEGHFVMKMRKHGGGAAKVSLMKSDPVPREAQVFLDQMLEKNYPFLLMKNGKLYGGTAPFFDTGRIHLLRHQVLLGEMKGKTFVPSHHLFTSAYSGMNNCIELDETQCLRYLHGEEIMCEARNGWYAVMYKGYVLGGAKCSCGRLKNKYPTQLRMR